MLVPLATDLWTQQRPLRFFGLEVGTRMTVVRLESGGLFVHSPVALDDETRAAVDALGRVEVLVAPTLFHHLYIAEWARSYPDASVSVCPGLEKKRRELAGAHVLSDVPDSRWEGELDQVFFRAFSLANEVVFFHRKSNTVVCSDFMLNLASHRSRLTRVVGGFVGTREPGVTLLERLAIRDRAAAGEQVGRIVAWRGERLVLAHGEVVESGASAVIAKAYRWLGR